MTDQIQVEGMEDEDNKSLAILIKIKSSCSR